MRLTLCLHKRRRNDIIDGIYDIPTQEESIQVVENFYISR